MMKKNISSNDPLDLFTRIFVALFFLILWLPLVQMNFPVIPELTTHENRKLAEKPRIRQMSDLRHYARNYADYFNDHYGFRSFLVRLNSLLHLTVFNTSPTQRVIIGDQGWLWYNDPQDGVSLKDYYGRANFTEDELKRIKDRIIHFHNELMKINIHFLLVIAPNKHTIYPEYLPANIRQARGMKTRLDQLTQTLNKSGVDFIDLSSRLLAEKKHTAYPLYYRTDTHWNDLGAFFGYEQIITRLRRTYPGIKQLGSDDFITRAEENREPGDLAGFLNMSGLLTDTHITLTPRVKLRATMVSADYAYRSGNDTVGFQIPNCGLPTLVMFRDSFTDGLIPFLSESFSKSIYLKRTRENLSDFSIYAREKPAIVILEIVERNIGDLLEL